MTDAAELPPVGQPELREYGNTGPKGVIADYKEAEVRLAERLERKREAYAAQAEKNSFTVSTARQDEAEAAARTAVEADDALGLEDQDTEAAFLRYKEQRVREMLEARRTQQEEAGAVRTLGTYDYMQTVQNADPECFVVVHIFEKSVEGCRRINEMLERLGSLDSRSVGRCGSRALLCRITLADALDSFEERSLPALLVYRRGQLESCHMKCACATLAELVELLRADGLRFLPDAPPEPLRRPRDSDDEGEEDDSISSRSEGNSSDDDE